jgi:hypothetical protein
MNDERTARLLRLRDAAREISDPQTSIGKRARGQLLETTGLSPLGIDFALQNCLEHHVPRGVLSSLVKQTERVGRAHVLLSANVFVATFRAIALALCQSTQVSVRASRREPTMATLLHEGSRGAFDLVESLHPEPGDHVWAYGTDETLKAFGETLVSGVLYHAHGPGMGAAIFRESFDIKKTDLLEAARALARDVCVFDQRGCLSPRVLIIEGSRSFAESVCDLMVEALELAEVTMPRGSLSDDEIADARWHEETIQYIGCSVRAGRGMVFLDPEPGRLLIPPVGRYLNVVVTDDCVPLIENLKEVITTVGIFNPGHLHGRLREAIGERRFVDVGEMQKPAFDGPVDKRLGWTAQLT